MTMDKPKKHSFKKTEVSVSVFSDDISKNEKISRWRPIDKALHYNFSATKMFFKKRHNAFIKNTRVLSINGFNKKRNEAFSKITTLRAYEVTHRRTNRSLNSPPTLELIITVYNK